MIVGASAAEQEIARAPRSKRIWFPDGIERIITLPDGIWTGLERFRIEHNWPVTGFAEVAFEHAQNTILDIDFEAKVRRAFDALAKMLCGYSYKSNRKPVNVNHG
jgi:hypothetical protein